MLPGIGRVGCAGGGLEFGVGDGLLQLLVLGAPEVPGQPQLDDGPRGPQHVHRMVVAQPRQTRVVNLHQKMQCKDIYLLVG